MTDDDKKSFKNFLHLYDYSDEKIKEIINLDLELNEKEKYLDLIKLPGVKATRAGLYIMSGFDSLKDIASSTQEKIIEATIKTIDSNNLHLKVPLRKEVKTHIAVATALTKYKDF